MSAPNPDSPSDFVCWSPSEESDPVRIKAANGQEAAKLFVLREQAEAQRHDNDWSAAQVLVICYTTGQSYWFTVKVTVEATQ